MVHLFLSSVQHNNILRSHQIVFSATEEELHLKEQAQMKADEEATKKKASKEKEKELLTAEVEKRLRGMTAKVKEPLRGLLAEVEIQVEPNEGRGPNEGPSECG